MSIKYLRGGWSGPFPALALLAVLVAAAIQLTPPEPEAPRPRGLTLEHRYPVSALAFTPDGTTLAVGGGRPEQVAELTLWDLAIGRQRIVLGELGASVEAVAFDPEGTTLVAMHYDGTVRR